MDSINEIFADALKLPEYARVEYFQMKQKECGYSDDTFHRMLIDSAIFWTKKGGISADNLHSLTMDIEQIFATIKFQKSFKELTTEIDRLKNKKTKGNNENIISSNPIRDELKSLVAKMEEKIKEKLNDKIWRAAYCEYLFNNNYFESKMNRIKTCNEFAKLKWGEDIKNQLKTTCKPAREKHIKTLNIKFRDLQV